MNTIKTSSGGIDYLLRVLRDKKTVVSRAALWRIPHHSNREDICLKIGRYRKEPFEETLESQTPKSELTLDDEEFHGLLDFLHENYEPFRRGFKEFVPLGQEFDRQQLPFVRQLFLNPDRQKLLQIIAEHQLVPKDLTVGLEQIRRSKAVEEFQAMLVDELKEHDWQKWFLENDWVLGSEFVRVLDERQIDTKKVADYLVEAYDGFLDIVEIKRPERNLRFWAAHKDHDNYVPSTGLVKALTQASNYLFAVEREANSLKFLERTGGVRTIKPRCVLIFGRSNLWDSQKRESYRILNSNFYNLTILTYDHVLDRARRMVGLRP